MLSDITLTFKIRMIVPLRGWASILAIEKYEYVQKSSEGCFVQLVALDTELPTIYLGKLGFGRLGVPDVDSNG